MEVIRSLRPLMMIIWAFIRPWEAMAVLMKSKTLHSSGFILRLFP